MFCVLDLLFNDRVRIRHFSRACLAIMAGEGTGWHPDEIAYNIQKSVNLSGKPFDVAAAFVMGMGVGGLSELQAMERIMERDRQPDVLDCWLMDEAELPYHVTGNEPHDPASPDRVDGASCFNPACHDRYFRKAVRYRGGAFTIDMPQARTTHMDRIRVRRNRKLATLDAPYMIALETGDTDTQARIATEKQALRDIPQTLDLTVYSTPEELKAAWPAELPKPGA